MKEAIKIVDKYIVELEEEINSSRLKGSAQSTNQLITTKRLLEDIKQELVDVSETTPVDPTSR